MKLINIQLIVGLGNIGSQYEETRHNVGFWFIDRLVQICGIHGQLEKKFFGWVGKGRLDNQEIRLLKPSTLMNLSGKSVTALASFYRIPVQSILIVHDELDFSVGVGRIKQGGGHGGHNGLRSIISSLGNQADFLRLRLAIGHPGDSRLVSNYVLSKPSISDRQKIESVIEHSIALLSNIVQGDRNEAIHRLHTYTVK